MAPTHTGNNSHRTLSIMSCPNNNALASSNNRMRVIHIGKDSQPVSLPKMATVNAESWRKAASYQTLNNSVYSLLQAHTVADVVTLVSNELPMDTNAAFQEAQTASLSILGHCLHVENLEPMAFLSSTGKSVTVDDVVDLSERPEDITFLRFRSLLDASKLDARVTKMPPLNFHFCLRLPQYIYDVAAKTASLASAPVCASSRSLISDFNAINSTPPSTPINTGINSVSATSTSYQSPAMKLFLTSSSKSKKERKGYYGGVSFLDSQNEFNLTFGIEPVMLPEKPNDYDSLATSRILQTYTEKCKFDIFMHLCRLDYVGSDKIDPTLSVQEVCRKISDLKQVYSVNGKVFTDTPDDIFDKYISLVVNLPDNAAKWPIQLCSAYFAALTSDLASAMTDDKLFVMPDLTTLPTKATQLAALRKVRSQAATSYKVLKKTKETMTALLRSMNKTQNRGLNFYAGTDGTGNHGNMARGQNYFSHSPSLAETTMSRYNSGTGSGTSNNDSSRPQVVTRTHPSTGLQHPYDKDRNYLSQFPVTFKGCFHCGDTNHSRTKDCPSAQAGTFDKTKFFSEMWAHKPHTKRPDMQQRVRFDDKNRGNVNIMGNNTDSHNNDNNALVRYQNSDKNQNHYYNNRNDNNHGNYNLDNHDNQYNHNHTESTLRNGNRHVDNTPAWLIGKNNDGESKKDSKSKRQRLFVVYGSVLNVSGNVIARKMPLSIDNDLPSTVLRFGSSDKNEIAFAVHCDSCAAMNTANELLHMWIMTTYPEIVLKYERYDDVVAFQPITLDCAIPTSNAEKDKGKLSSVVTYKTRYHKEDGTMMTLSFGLGEDILVNAIIGLPTFREWQLVLDISENRVFSKMLNLSFDLSFQHAATGLPDNINFTKDDFVRPIRPNPSGQALVTQLAAASTTTVGITQTDDYVILDLPAPVVIKDNLTECTSTE